MEVIETPLPGLGSRYEFTTESGSRVGVIARRDRRRDFVVYDSEDPDACRVNVPLTTEESSVLVELLGGTKITENINDLHHEIEGLAMEWITMTEGATQVGHTIGDSQIRGTTGALVVAVIREVGTTVGPGPDFEFATGDVVLVIGSADSVDAATDLLTR